MPSDLGEFVVVPLDASRMHARLGADDRPLSEMEADAPITLHLARELGFDRFALIESDAEGGQAATVYHGRLRAMPVRQGPGAINEALERIGVRPEGGRDAFDTLGLGSVVQAGIGASG
ncbi:hypothetical protein [Pararhodobacter marinus]|uniref:hypothetical protein n=1 Tax=Pararhodobacter marinus TaxID=2184063 RepID=UPI0035181B59